ncbi:hypothetical protein B0O80DRAFT_22740 [Mortierella sp. GBAus27b]|nr:hypothetical protein B0O80DRAFT_22740 [Mortierella sp. GBAus27b]
MRQTTSLTSLKRSRPRKQSTSSSSDHYQSMRLSHLPVLLSLATSIPTSKRSRTSFLQLDRLPSFSSEGSLPTTSGSIHGLPRAWRRGFGNPPETRPSLLSMDLPDPSTPDSTSRNLAAGSILDMVENDRHHIPVFGVSGCGKTRAVIGLLSQHWGFYFNAADDDWGSGDMMTLYNTVRSYLKEIQAASTAVDLEINYLFARMTTLLLFLSRLLVFKYCLHVSGSNGMFNSARWILLQV